MWPQLSYTPVKLTGLQYMFATNKSDRAGHHKLFYVYLYVRFSCFRVVVSTYKIILKSVFIVSLLSIISKPISCVRLACF